MKPKQNYILEFNPSAQKRLELQDKIYAESSRQFVVKSGLKSYMHVLEVGCANGSMTTWLANHVKQVTAIDISKEYIDIAKIEADRLNQKNINYVQKDLHDIMELNETYDLIYSRMVLPHLTDPKIALKKLRDVLKSQGILVCEEPPIVEGAFCYPHSDAFETMKKLVIELFKKLNLDYQLPYKLPTYLSSLGFCNLQMQLFQPLLNNLEEKLIHSMGTREVGAKFVELGLATEKETDRLVNELEKLAYQPVLCSYMRMFQISGMYNLK